MPSHEIQVLATVVAAVLTIAGGMLGVLAWWLKGQLNKIERTGDKLIEVCTKMDSALPKIKAIEEILSNLSRDYSSRISAVEKDVEWVRKYTHDKLFRRGQ